MQAPRFIRVSKDGARFEDGASGRPFHFVGANCYYLLTRAADPGLRHECTAVLDAAAAAGLTVIRLWAFADGAGQWNALQPQPGVFEEHVFRALDWLLAAAAERRLRLLPVLTNYWKDFGGMRQYVAWACAQRGLQAEDAAPDSFYGDPACRSMFQAAAQALVGRTNAATGVRYRDDPTILAWSLANEPRCAGDHAAAAIPCWARWAAGLLKGLDPNHMVTLDSEGFLGPSTPAAAAHNPYSCAGSGCDFAAEAALPAIDFASCHLYPELWLPQADGQAQLRFAPDWLHCHVQLSRQLGKPLVLSEWGKRQTRQLDSCAPAAGGGAGRADFFEQVLASALRHMEAGNGLAGTAFWMLAARSYPDHDGFTVYLSATAQQDNHTAAVLKQHAAAVAELNHRQPQAGQAPETPDRLLPASCPAGTAEHAGSHRAAGSRSGHHEWCSDDVPRSACPSCPLM